MGCCYCKAENCKKNHSSAFPLEFIARISSYNKEVCTDCVNSFMLLYKEKFEKNIRSRKYRRKINTVALEYVAVLEKRINPVTGISYMSLTWEQKLPEYCAKYKTHYNSATRDILVTILNKYSNRYGYRRYGFVKEDEDTEDYNELNRYYIEIEEDHIDDMIDDDILMHEQQVEEIYKIEIQEQFDMFIARNSLLSDAVGGSIALHRVKKQLRSIGSIDINYKKLQEELNLRVQSLKYFKIVSEELNMLTKLESIIHEYLSTTS